MPILELYFSHFVTGVQKNYNAINGSKYLYISNVDLIDD